MVTSDDDDDDSSFETCKCLSLPGTVVCIHKHILLPHVLISHYSHIEVLQRVKTPNTKPKKPSESGSEDR